MTNGNPRGMKKLRLGLLQYSITPDAQKNLDGVLRLLNGLIRKKIHIAVLPEMFLGSPQKPGERKEWHKVYQRAEKELALWCCRHRISLIYSSLEKRREKFFNTACFINEKGRMISRYRKMHLFSLGGETKIFSSGSEAEVFNTRHGKMACVVCYDIRFPELIRSLALKGPKILFVCAQWPDVRRQHWLTLLSARAIENQFFVVGVNRLGKKGPLSFRGHSVVISPWGKELLHLGPNKQSGVVEIDLGEVEKVRKKYPFLKERKIKN